MAEVKLRIQTANGTNEFALNDLLQKLGITAPTESVELVVQKNNCEIKALAYPREDEYPKIDIDASDENGETIYLANAELPNEDMPDAVTARLYAGYEKIEVDEPIALVKTQLRGQHELQSLNAAVEIARRGRPFIKNVHVDTRIATIQTWTTNENITEHF